MAEEEGQEISIEDLELSLEVYEIEAEEKVKKLQQLFKEKQSVDLGKMFYEQKSSLEIKFQNIISDLTEFLINQQIASTDKLRKTFYRILENPMTFLFKVSRFEIFNLRLNAFDIELEPIDAVCEVGSSLLSNIDKHEAIVSKLNSRYDGSEYKSFEEFLEQAQIRVIHDLIFTFYSYLRKGGKFIKKKFEDKVRVVEIYNQVEKKLIKGCIERADSKTLKQLSLLNYELYLLESSYDVLCFYLKVPLRSAFAEVFRELETLGTKAKQNSNYDLFILIFLRFSKEIMAKLDVEGIDESFSSYIENVLTAILDLWGCRLCYYQEFYELFYKLLSLHSNKAKALQICLKYNPQLKKDDIVLLRTNFKHELIQKQSELLSLLKSKSMEEVNTALSALYHQTLYNLDFKDYTREQLINLVSLLNGNTSFKQFFAITERAFKEWNHSIDFTNPHKYIEGQFKYPNIDESKVRESLRLLNNLCILESKSQNDFEQLVKAGSIQRIFIGFSSFLFTNEKTSKLLAESQDLKLLLVNILQFLKRVITNSADWQPACLLYSSHLQKLTDPHTSVIMANIKQMVTQNFSAFSIKNLLTIFKNIVTVEQKLQLPSAQSTYQCVINNFMKGTEQKNEQIKNFRFFDTNLSDHGRITKSEEKFLKQNACLNGDVIEVKNFGCFTLSELQIITNPVQFDKVMDNYYFALDKNAKRFIQHLTIDWSESKAENLNSTISIIKQLIKKYPISIPLLCSTRVSVNNQVSRFIEFIVRNINEEAYAIVNQIVECRCIRYKNGRDYVREQVLPLILKETIKRINADTKQAEHYELLALCLKNSAAADIKIDLIQNSIDAIKYQISVSSNEEQAYRLSKSHLEVLRKFFEKKQRDMRKKGLKNIFEEEIWHENRIKASSLQNQNKASTLKKTNINEQIMISPYTAPHQFESNEVKMEKISSSKKKDAQNPEVDISSLEKVLTNKALNSNLGQQRKNENLTTVDLSNLKYDIESHLGTQILKFCRKEGYKIVTPYSDGEVQSESNQQNITFVQYYLKQFQIPEISVDLVLKYLYAMLTNKVQYSSLFSNLNNIEKLFSSMILLLSFCANKVEAPKNKDSVIDNKILGLNSEDRNLTVKAILKIFSAIGYTNLWAQSFNSLKQVDYLKDLRVKCQFKEQDQEQTFLSWVLRIGLQNEQVKQELNELLGSIFTTRPKEQNSLMYKVTLNRGLLNLIMKSLEITNLSYVSLLFHSNYNNLRLYTDQLHEGLKALNMASKNRAYNQYVQLSKDLEDQQFYQPMKLFKENFDFFINIEAEGYRFKRAEEEKIGRERVLKVLRSGVAGDKLCAQVEKVIDQFEVQLEKLQSNIASRVKAFYLATKLRDLSYQNSLTICLLYEILSENKESQESILRKINYIELFSLMMKLYTSLVRFDRSASCENFLHLDRSIIQKDVNICSTRRYSHSMSKVYEKCDLQLDEVIQRCLDGLKYFFTSKLGKEWVSTLNAYPPFLTKSFIDIPENQKNVEVIKSNINKANKQYSATELTSTQTDSFVGIVKGLRQLKKGHILAKDKVKIKWSGKSYGFAQFLAVLKQHLLKSETLIKSKDGFLLFNKYKTSEKTLEEIELFGVIVGYCVFWGIEMDLPLHSSLLAAIGFGLCDLQDLLDIDFKVWEDLRNVMSTGDSKTLNLNFSYNFESLQTLKVQRVELTDKGTSKKVNNLNREEYCDLVCCYLLYKTVSKQLHRFLESICYICPKQLLSTLKITDLHRFFIKKHPKYSEQILRQHMKKRGLVLPDTVLSKGKRIENLKDYQSIQWLCELVEENPQIKDKIWKNEQNIFVCTWMGQGIEYQSQSKLLLLGRVKDKEELKRTLTSLK